MANTSPKFSPVGNFGVEAAITPDGVLFKVPTNRDNAQASASGKMKLLGSSGGWQSLPGSDGLKFNLQLGFKA